MENMSNIGNLFAFSHDSVVYVENGIIAYLNPPALALFGRDKQGLPENALLPEQLLDVSNEDFVASATVDGKIMTVCRTNYGKHKLYSFFPPNAQEEQLAIHAVSAAMRELTNSIKTTSDLIQDWSVQYDDPFMQKYSAVMKHNTAKMKRLVNNYSLFTEFRTGERPFHPEMESLSEICQEVVDEALALSHHRRISIVFRKTDDIIASVDRDLLQQLLTNLISNSLNSMEREGAVIVELRPTKKHIVISVQDNGCGMPTDMLVNAFKGYQSPVDLSTGTFSAGLGLSVADAIAKLHGGALVIESKVGEGTKVTLQLPVVVDRRLKSPKVRYKVPLKEFMMTGLSTWLNWEDFLYYDKKDFEERMARKAERKK